MKNCGKMQIMEKFTEYISELNEEFSDYTINTHLDNIYISVIVPAYNSEKYLKDCLGSLIKQTFKNFEIIAIDDGSKDHTYDILNAFSHIDKRIKVISQKNAGVSAARNRGIEASKGQYITFLDSDDWIDENYIEALYNAITKNDCDIAVSNMIRKRKTSQKYRLCFKEENVFGTYEDKIRVCRIPLCCYSCGKLFNKELFNKIKFQESLYFEDVILTPQILYLSNRLVTVPNTTYWYRVNNNSIVKKEQNKQKQFDAYKAKKFALDFIFSKGIIFPPKTYNLTKEIKYCFGIPILKIKEQNGILITKLFDLIPIKHKKISEKLQYKTLKKGFFIRNLDSHCYIELFKSIKISVKNNNRFKYEEAKNYGLENTTRNPKLIVSLTSFPERIATIHLTINTLLNQTIKPDKLILWLADSQFSNKENDLPEELLNLKKLGLEIRWCEDIKPYKKLIPALREFPEDIIVTADDDLYYQKDWLESLYNEYLKNPNYIYTRRACRVNLKNNLLSVAPHYANYNYEPTYLNQLMGGAGTLYPPHSLHEDVFNIEQIKELIPTHDDIYLWIMAILKGTKICLIKNKDVNLYSVENSQTQALCKQNGNNTEGLKPKDAFERILNKYPEAYDLIERESAC